MKFKKSVLLVFLTLFSFNTNAQIFSQNFDALSQIPSDWMVADNGVGLGKSWGINTVGGTSAHSQVYSAEMKTGDNANGATFEDWLISPAINVSSLSKPEFHFWARNGVAYNQYSKIQVRVSTVSQDRSTFTTILGEWDEVHVGSTNPISAAYNTWAEKTIDLTNYKSYSQIYIAFVVINTGIGDTWLLDDISIIDSPSNVTITNITAISATLSWDPAIGNPTMYEIELRKADQPFTGVRTAYINTPSPGPISNTYQANPLDYKTDYKFYVRAVYGTIKSVWSGPYDFKTNIFYESFDKRTVLPPGWIVRNNGVGLTYDWRIYSSTAHSHNFSTRSMLVSPEDAITNGGTIEDWLITSAINMSDFSKPELNFWAKSRYGLYGNSKIEVRVSTTSQTDLSTFIPLAEWNEFFAGISNPIASANDVYGEQTVDLSAFVTASQVYVAFVITNEGNGDIWLIDDVSVIDKPVNLTATAITTNSATLAWSVNSENPNYEIEMLNAGQNPTGIPTATVSTNSFNATGLNQATQYEYYVRSVYVNAKSSWSGPFSFVTASGFPQGFESGVPPSGWVINDNGVGTQKSWALNTAFPRTGTKAIFLDIEEIGVGQTSEDWLISPAVTMPTNGQLRFWLRQLFIGNQGTIIKVLVSTTSQTDHSTFSLVKQWTETELNEVNNTSYFEHIANFPATYFGQQVYIAIVRVGTQVDTGVQFRGDRILLDDLNLVERCLDPYALNAVNINQENADLLWSIPNAPTSFEIKLVNITTGQNFDNGQLLTSTTPHYSLSGLSADTNYHFYVRALCSNNIYSEWIGPLSFATMSTCMSYIPTNLSFANYDGTSADISWTPATDETLWEVFIRPLGEDFPSSGVIVTNTPTYHLSGLDNEIVYDVVVKKFCNSLVLSSSPLSIPVSSACIKENTDGRSAYVTNLFKNFIHELLLFSNSGGIVDENYQSDAFSQLAPYVTVPNPRIHNFTNVDGTISFSFSENEESNYEDVVVSGYSQLLEQLNDVVFDDSGYVSPNYLSVNNRLFFENGTAGFSVKHINFCPEQLFESCTINNPNSQVVENLFLNLLKYLYQRKVAGDTDAQINLDAASSAAFTALRAYITDSNAGIYNFQSASGSMKFSFLADGNHDSEYEYDVYLDGDIFQIPNLNDLNLSSYISSVNYLDLKGDYPQLPGLYHYFKKFDIRHINFCPDYIVSCTENNPKSQIVHNYFVQLLKHLITQKLNNVSDATINATINNSSQLLNLKPFITDQNPGVYNFQSVINSITNELVEISFSFSPNEASEPYDVHINGNVFDIPNVNFEINLSGYGSSNTHTPLYPLTDVGIGLKNSYFRHINFCPDEIASCTVNNPNSQVVKDLFIALVTKLANTSDSLITDGYTCPELAALSPYITDSEPAIYDYENNHTGRIKFSFSNHTENSTTDVDIETNGFPISALDINYASPELESLLTVFVNNSPIISSQSHVRHINFCPNEIYCVSHVSLVIDESGSIDETEIRKIKKQLKAFIQQQADTNDSTGSNIKVSLIGMSDSDENNRTDNIAPIRVTNSNKGQFMNWINNYGARYGEQGISASSDYWKSGLTVALNPTSPPDVVIMITDGCQTADAIALKTTMQGFDNYRATSNPFNNSPLNPNAPHLYVVGIDNGFYVDSDVPTSGRISSRREDPNYVPTLHNISQTVRVSSFLAKSLQYLFNYPPSVFPESDIDNFHKDYFGHNDFNLLASDEIYFSVNLTRGEVEDKFICGMPYKDICDDCYSFQPEPNKDYLLSAWVKEDSNIQLKTYTNATIKLVFYNTKDIVEGDADQIISSPVFEPSGEIIDGWQRIVAKFTIPEATITMGFELINGSNGTPIYFDDIRIHPLKGSMKSFVYDSETFKLMSELDENNYSTFYEYDNEGGLVRVKKETSKGIKTIQETRSGNVITPIAD